MTSSSEQPPKEYIITEFQLKQLQGYADLDFVCQAIRSRPHPAPYKDENGTICIPSLEFCRSCNAHAQRKAREGVQPFIDLVRVIETKNREMADLMRRNGMKIDNLQDPMQKLAFTFYSEIGEMAHKAEVVIKEYEESTQHTEQEQPR